MKIQSLPGSTLSPETVLHQNLEQIDEIDAIVIMKMTKDGRWLIDWSNMAANDIAFAHRIFGIALDEMICGEGGENVVTGAG